MIIMETYIAVRIIILFSCVLVITIASVYLAADLGDQTYMDTVIVCMVITVTPH